MDTESFIVHIKTNRIYKDTAQTKLDPLNYELDRSLPEGTNKN